MNLRTLILAAAVAAGAASAMAQPTGDRVSLKLGTATVYLGMPAEQAVSGMKAAGYTILRSDAQGAVVQYGEGMYLLRFAKGTLVYAQRPWFSSKTTVVDALFGALESLAASRPGQCSIVSDPIARPEIQADRIYIRCGGRSVFFVKGVSQTGLDVNESIGKMPAQ